MKKLNNIQLLFLLLFALVFISSAVGLNIFNDQNNLLIFCFLVFGTGLLASVTPGIIWVALKNKDSIWLQAVSNKTGKVLINCVVLIWLCAVGLIVFILLLKAGWSIGSVIAATLSLLVGAGVGRFFQIRLSSRTWLPYGVSFLGALIAIMLFLGVLT